MTQQVKVLELKDYLALALITKAPSSSLYEDFTHSICGLTTEVAEVIDQYKRHWFYKKPLDIVNLKEELGDIMWYVAVGLHALEREFPDVQPVDADETYEAMTDKYILGKMVKYSTSPTIQGFCYAEDWDVDARNYFQHDLINLLGFLNVFAKRIGTTLQEAAYLNIVKLSKRYPAGFTEFNALNRDTVNELSHIEA